MDVVVAIERLLKSKGWTKYKLAKEAGLPQSTITSLLSGRVSNPSMETLSKVSSALGVTISTIVGGAPGTYEEVEIGIIETTSDILKMLDRISDDTLFFPDYLHEDLFNIFIGSLPIEDEDGFFKYYKYEYLNLPPEDKETLYEEVGLKFDKLINYGTVKKALKNHSRMIRSRYSIYEIKNMLADLIESKYIDNENNELDNRVRKILEDPQAGVFFQDYLNMPEEKRAEIHRFLKFIQEAEKGRKPGDKQSE